MVSTVNTKIIEMILNREMKFTDLNFEPETWYDAFIVELLKWYNNLRYLFSDDKDDKYNDLHMLENLIELYKIIINNIPNLNKIYRNKEYIDVSIDVFIDKWNNTDMHNKLNIIELRNKARNRITYVIDRFDEIAVQYYLDEDEAIILKFFKDFLIDLRSNKIKLNC